MRKTDGYGADFIIVPGLDQETFMDACREELEEERPKLDKTGVEKRCKLRWRIYEARGDADDDSDIEELEEELARLQAKPQKFYRLESGRLPEPIVRDPRIKADFIRQVITDYCRELGWTKGYARSHAEMAWRKSGVPDPEPVSFDAAKVASERKKWRLAVLDRIPGAGYKSVKGYGIEWGLPNTQGQVITPQTDLWLDRSGEIPITLYGHGSEYGQQIGKATTRRKDDIGTWLEAQLSVRNRFEEMVKDKISTGKLWMEPGVPYARAKGLQIKEMPLLEVSLVPELDLNGYRVLSDDDLARLGYASKAVKGLLGAL